MVSAAGEGGREVRRGEEKGGRLRRQEMKFLQGQRKREELENEESAGKEEVEV